MNRKLWEILYVSSTKIFNGTIKIRYLPIHIETGRFRGTELEFILFANVTCIMISEKLCIGQLNINILIFICMITKTNLYF